MATRRIEEALASLFLPRDSVYAQLDNPPSPVPSPRSPSLASQPLSPPPSRAQPPLQVEQEDDQDPFAPSPSVLSPALKRTELPDNASAGRRPSPQRPPPSLGDSRSPFIERPVDEESIYSPASSSRSPTRGSTSHASSPPRAGHPSRSSAGSSNGLGSSSIGNRSLMGLLGGTRYDPHSFDGLGLGVGGEVLEEDEDEEGDDALGEFRSRGRGDQLSLSESRALASSLPPPPSALSDTTSQSSHSDEEEGDGHQPPDFTSRVPLASSRSHSSRSRRPRPSATSSSSHTTSPTWAGLRLGGPREGLLPSSRRAAAGMSAKERALWRWINVEDLDAFLQQVYLYYVGKGIWAMLLERVLNLLTIGWVIFFSTFLVGCIDYSVLWDSHSLHEVVVSQCVSRFSSLTFILVLAFSAFYAWRVIRFGLGVKELWEMHEFWTELLEVNENDIQTIPWHSIVTRLSALRATHPSALSSRSSASPTAHRLDAHDVANRIMREENYLIALFNKDVLDLSVPMPAMLQRLRSRTGLAPSDRKGWGEGMLTKALEWNLGFCLIGFLFGSDGQVRRAFLMERNKKELVEALRRRFILMGLVNAVFAPFIILYLLMYSFFRYFEEYHKNPSSIGSRQFTPLARWKFREFNELPHLFHQRLKQAHPLADSYLAQFPKEKTALVSRFVAFLAGSFAAVLILFSLIDPDAFLHFEVTKGRTVLFYIGLFGTILAVARGMVPDENKVVDTEETMRRIVEHTHYLPEEWKDKLHSAEVHASFSLLFPMKVVVFLHELLSVLITPFVLWYSLPACSGPIVDFFREFTVHVDGLGYVCSFAVFDFKRHGDVKFGAPVQVQEERWKSGEGKMEKSFLNFAAHNPLWVPRDQTQSLFLSKMTDTSAHPPPPPVSNARPPAAHSSGLHHRFGSANPHARSSSRPNRFAGLGASIVEETSNDLPRLSAVGGGGGASSLPSSRLLDPQAGRGSRLRGQPSSTVGTTPPRLGGGLRSPPLSAGRALMEEEPIIEESRLDGQSFIAPTQGRPFGMGSEEEREELEENTRSDQQGRDGKQGLGGIIGELYGIQGKRW